MRAACSRPARRPSWWRNAASATLEDAFIAYLAGGGRRAPPPPTPTRSSRRRRRMRRRRDGFSLRRLLAYAIRETLELLARSRAARLRAARHRVPDAGVRLRHQHGCRSSSPSPCSTATRRRRAAPISKRSRLALLRRARADRGDSGAMERRLASGELQARDRNSARLRPRSAPRRARRRSAAWIDGAMPFRAETTRGYVQGVHAHFLAEPGAVSSGACQPQPHRPTIEIRFRYNQDFDSVKAMVPAHDRRCCWR